MTTALILAGIFALACAIFAYAACFAAAAADALSEQEERQRQRGAEGAGSFIDHSERNRSNEGQHHG